MIKPVLKFPLTEINALVDRYQYPILETDLLELKPRILQQGYLTKSDLEKITYWKAPRSAGNARKNAKEYVTEITRFAFATESERARVESLTLLDGVMWPTASVILH